MTVAEIAALIEHLPDCAAPDMQTYMKRHSQAVRTRCRTCGRGVDHDDPMAAHGPRTAPGVGLALPMPRAHGRGDDLARHRVPTLRRRAQHPHHQT